MLEFADVQYYNPESLLDYSGVILQTAAADAQPVGDLGWHRHPDFQDPTLAHDLGATWLYTAKHNGSWALDLDAIRKGPAGLRHNAG